MCVRDIIFIMEKQSKVLRWSLIIGIILVINLFFSYALSLAYKQPIYENFCPTAQVNKVITDQKSCLTEGGQWNETSSVITQANGAKNQPTIEKTSSGYCNLQYTCSKSYDSARKIYDRNVFVTLVALGVLCVIACIVIRVNAVLSVALSLSGVLSFVVASMRYWSNADDLVKVIILFVALVALIFVAVKKFKN